MIDPHRGSGERWKSGPLGPRKGIFEIGALAPVTNCLPQTMLIN
jgi:hypothetical protein